MAAPVADNSSDADLDRVRSLCVDLDPAALDKHLERLDQAYLERFDAPTIASHVRLLAKLNRNDSVQVILEPGDDRDMRCTVLAFDHPFEFSLITGLLAGTGIRIDSGDVFTFARVKAAGVRRDPRRSTRSRAVERHGLKSAVIIDCFTGQLSDEINSFDAWATRFKFSLTEVIALLEQNDETSVKQAKSHVNELVTDRLSRQLSTGAAMMLPVQLDINQVDAATRLRIVGQDTPAFLYSMATALSLHGLSIHRVSIRSEGDRVEDEIDVVDGKGRPILDLQLIERVKLSVLMTKQFTYFLDRSPDPFTALTRFERLTEDLMRSPEQSQWLDLLSNPRAMRDLAKILGTSDFLWEDFIRAQYESLLPIVTPVVEGRQFSHASATLPLRMEQALQGAQTYEEKRDQLNKFKDSEIFQIDLDHILNPSVDFRELSRRLTLLAEMMVANASRIVFEQLIERFGQPHDEDDEPSQYAVLGLGKLGGIALGYASDIELLFVYSALGETEGGSDRSISNGEFFEMLARETTQFIQTKREGIFEIDLRLRPYGKEGPLASSLNHVMQYYDPDGPAHPFERLALVRLRWIAGGPALGSAVERFRDRVLYQNAQFDLDTLWETWGRQRKQSSKAAASTPSTAPARWLTWKARCSCCR